MRKPENGRFELYIALFGAFQPAKCRKWLILEGTLGRSSVQIFQKFRTKIPKFRTLFPAFMSKPENNYPMQKAGRTSVACFFNLLL